MSHSEQNNPIFYGQSQAEETPGLQELIDSLTKEANAAGPPLAGLGFAGAFGGMGFPSGGMGTSPQQSQMERQIEQLARQMLGYGEDGPGVSIPGMSGMAGGMLGMAGSAYGAGMGDFLTGIGSQGGYSQGSLRNMQAAVGGGVGIGGLLYPGGSIMGVQQSALQQAQQT